MHEPGDEIRVQVVAADEAAVARTVAELDDEPAFVVDGATGHRRTAARIAECDLDCLVVGPGPTDDVAALVAALAASHPAVPYVLLDESEQAVPPTEVLGTDPAEVVVLDPDEATTGLVAVVRDAVAATEPAITRDGEWYHALLEATSDLTAVLDRHGTIQYIAPSVRHILGFDPDELIGESAFRYIHPDDRESVVEQYLESVSANDTDPPTLEFRFRDADGEWRRLAATARDRLDAPPICGYVINARDITARTENERELEVYKTVVEATPDAVYALDGDGRFILVNEVFESETGLSEAEVIGADPSILAERGVLDPDEVERALETTRSLITGEADSVRFELEIEATSGPMCTEQRVATFPDRDDRLGFVNIVRDISSRKAYERELERQNERLEEFASIVSHDLRSPLTVADGNLELAAETGEAEYFRAVERAHERMAALVDHLLAMARQGRTVESPQATTVAECARAAWTSVDTAGATIEIAEGRSPIAADPERLQQLFENLFRNAVEHAGAGVTIQIGPTDDGFYVADDGPGIPTDARQTVFEWGYTTESDGTGFGLAIVDSIVEAHGWSITVSDSETGGARFEVTGVEQPIA